MDRVDTHTVVAHLIVEVWSERQTRIAAQCNDIAATNRCAALDIYLAQVAVRCGIAVAVIDVDHQTVDLEKLQEQADGYVIESFYLPEDGSHWAKIIIVSDKGHDAVGKGWAVSNAYVPDNFAGSGEWHNIPYDREITDAHYTHLAIVANPRYEEALIMTPEEFKQYKAGKKEQLNQLQNSKQGVKTKMKRTL